DVKAVDSDGASGPPVHVYITDGSNGYVAPVIFDLDGDGFELTGYGRSNVLFDQDSDGSLDRSGWFSRGDGVLALDRNSDGAITTGSEISFVSDLPGAQSDLEGLSAYDTNGDRWLDQTDQRFGDFLVWRDANQDGVSQDDELFSLTDIGISR